MIQQEYKEKIFYKYRNLSDLERFLYIIMEKRIYGATYAELNDPMEGKFKSEDLNVVNRKKIQDSLERTRICSLLQKQTNQKFPDDFLMWSHYADSHKGCCIELKVTGRYNKDWDIIPIRYDENLPKVVNEDIHKQINYIVSVKTPIWKDEHEVRAVRQYSKETFPTNSKYFHIKIIAVYLGRKLKKEQYKFYAKIIKSIDSSIHVYKITEDKTQTGMYPKLTVIEI